MSKERPTKYELLTSGSIPKAVLRLALPAIVSVLITNLYNMADTAFVGRVSTQATASVGVVFAYMAILQAFSFFFGHGAGNYISRALGSKKEGEAEQMAAHGFFMCFAFGVVFGAVGLLFMDSLLKAMGATETILPDARNYFLYIAIASPFLMTSLVLNNLMRFQGNAAMAMIGISIGAVLNVGLDPLFIFTLNMGVGGAGLATMISQIVSWGALLFLERRRGGIPIRFKNFRPSWPQAKEIFKGGVPSLFRQGIMSVASILLNNAAKLYVTPEEVDSAIAAFSVVSRFLNLLTCIILGIGHGFQPVCGFNLGAKKPKRVKEAFRFAVIVSTCYAIVMSLVCFFFARNIVALFRSEDPVLLDIGERALKFSLLSFPLTGYSTIAGMYLQNANVTLPATLVSVSRSGLFYIPFLFLFGALWGVDGLCASQMAGDVCAFILAIPLTVHELKKMEKTLSIPVKGTD